MFYQYIIIFPKPHGLHVNMFLYKKNVQQQRAVCFFIQKHALI